MPARKPQSKTSPEKPAARAPTPKPRSRPAERRVSALAAGFRSARAKSLSAWRDAAFAVADGGEPPSSRELSALAADLGVKKPAAEFEADVDNIHRFRKCADRIERARLLREEALSPWDGSEDAIRKEVAELRLRADELENLIHPASAATSWVHGQARAMAAAPRVLGDFGKALDSINRAMEGDA